MADLSQAPGLRFAICFRETVGRELVLIGELYQRRPFNGTDSFVEFIDRRFFHAETAGPRNVALAFDLPPESVLELNAGGSRG